MWIRVVAGPDAHSPLKEKNNKMDEELLEEAKWVIVLFDQANTNQRIEQLGSRGIHLKRGIEDLRKAMVNRGIDPYRTKTEGVWQEGYSNDPHRS